MNTFKFLHVWTFILSFVSLPYSGIAEDYLKNLPVKYQLRYITSNQRQLSQ